MKRYLFKAVLLFLFLGFCMQLKAQDPPHPDVTISSNVLVVTAELDAEFDLAVGDTIEFITFYYKKQSDILFTSASGTPFIELFLPNNNSGTTLTLLDENTTYDYYVDFTYNLGNYQSDTNTFTTTSYTPATVQTNEASGIGATSATLNGSITIGSSSRLRSVGFQYGETTSYGSYTSLANYSSNTDVSRAISGLTSGTTYHYRIRATDYSSGTPITILGDDKQFTATAAPVISTFDSLTTSQFYVNWTFSGTASTYYLDVATDSDFDNMVSGFDNKDVGNVLTATVNGLTAGTTYYCRLRAELSGGGTTGNSATDNTITICDAPTATSASAIGVAQFTANWNTQTGASSYLLDVSLTNTFATFVGSYRDHKVAGGASISEVVSGLSPSTDYYYRLRAKNASGNSLYSNTIGPVTTLDVDEVEWDGSESTDWSTAANWEYNTVPTSTISAIVPSSPSNQPLIESAATAKELTIKPGASVSLSGFSSSLTISNGDLLLEGNSTSVGELVVLSNFGASVTIQNGSAKFQQYVPGQRWVFFSIPYSGMVTNELYLNDDPEVYFKQYIESGGFGGGTTYCEDCWQYITSLSDTIEDMRGYAMWIAGSAHTYNFSRSAFITGTKSYSLQRTTTSTGDGWNLIGNPYPSHIDWDATAIDNQLTNLENKGFYIWDGSKYIAYNNELGTNYVTTINQGKIPPFQAFFVRSKSVGSTDFYLYNTTRTSGSVTHYKSSKSKPSDYIRLRAQKIGADSSMIDDLIVRFADGAKEGYDPDFDAYKMYGSYDIPQLFTYLEDGTELCINGLPSEKKDYSMVPVGIFVASDCEIEIKAKELSSFNHSIPIKFIDHFNEESFDLHVDSLITLKLDSGMYSDRFSLKFGDNTNIPDQPYLINDRVFINSDNQYINIAVLGEDVQLPLTAEVFDITGKLINKTLVNKTGTSRIYMQHNVKTCVIRLTGNNINKVQKLIIN